MHSYRVAYDGRISGAMDRGPAEHVARTINELSLDCAAFVVKDAAYEKLPLDRGTLETACYYLMANGKKIMAIKLYRWHTGLGLRESKEAVEKLIGGDNNG